MPIRMEKDPQKPDRNEGRRRRNPNQQGSGGGFSPGRILPMILMLVFKKPKLLVPVLIIGGLWYFFFGGSNMLAGPAAEDENFSFSLGANLDQQRYDKAEVFEPLAAGKWNNTPRSVSLLKYAPTRGQQGRQGSCVGWASAYGARTILQARATGQNPDAIRFSPAYLYNQIALSGCQGAYMLDAMKTMKSNGGVPFDQFRYDDRDCSNEPGSALINMGRQFQIKGYNRLTVGGNTYTPDIDGIRQNLAQGAPVVIGMQVGGTFMSRMMGKKVWHPTSSDRTMRGFSGHAMCVIGYDDDLEGGAFQIMNSWGERWGQKGIGWVKYGDFQDYVKEAYGLYPMGSADQINQDKLAVEFGLLDLKSEQTIPLEQAGDILFRSTRPINKGDKFKVLVANTIECYVYVFGQETDGSSYVLFPYTEKHSAYCGITGTRLFPRDYSMKADELGTTDYMAIVVSKKALDFNALNANINNSRQRSYADKLKEAVGSQRMTNAQFQAGNTVAFAAESKTQNVVATVIALSKQ